MNLEHNNNIRRIQHEKLAAAITRKYRLGPAETHLLINNNRY